MSDESPDVAGVLVFPPLIPLAVLLVGVPLDLWLRPEALNAIPMVARAAVGVVLLALGAASAIAGERAFDRAGTNVNPFRPALNLAGQGIYARMRNPMYVGMGLAVLGIAAGFALECTLAALAVGALIMHFGVVRREERYLERKFGEEYRRYKESVPRYGWKL